jgi:glutathione S-transferase
MFRAMPSRPLLLYSGPLSMFGAKTQIAALEKGIDFELVMVPFDFHALYSPKHPEVLRINPKRQVPVLVHDGLELFDSTQIFEYFEDLQPEPPLWPRDVPGRARARRLELESDEVYFPFVIKLMSLQKDLQGGAATEALAGAIEWSRRLDAQLAGRDWLAGDHLTYADIAYYMASFFGERLGAPWPAELERLQAWRARMTERPAVRAVIGPMARWLHANSRPLPPFVHQFLT